MAKRTMARKGYGKRDLAAVLDSPEITEADWKRAKPFAEIFPELAKSARRPRGVQRTPTKVPISIRLSRNVLEYFKATGPGWQARIDEVLRKAAGVKD